MPDNKDRKENQLYIHNSALHALLLGSDVGITPEKIGLVNDYLYRNHNKLGSTGIFDDAAKFEEFVSKLYNLMGPEVENVGYEKFKELFGLNGPSLEFSTHEMALNIKLDCTWNLKIYEQLESKISPMPNEIYGRFLALKKSKCLSSEQITPVKINANLGSSKTAAEFMDKYNLICEPGIDNDVFFKAKKEFLSHNDPIQILPAIKTMKNQYEELHKENESFKKTIKNTESLMRLDPKHLERPVSTSKGREHAKQLKLDFEELAIDCDLYLKHLNKSRVDLFNILASIPDNSEVKLLKELQKNVENELKDVLANIVKFNEIKAKIQGEGPKDPGFVLAIDNSLKKLNYQHNAHGVSREVVDEAQVGNADNNNAQLALDKPLELVERLAPGKCKVVTLVHGSDATGQPFKGKLVERQGEEQSTVNNKGEFKTVVPTTFELREFPSGSGSEDAKIFVAMNIAAEILANLNEAPDKKHPIQLSGEKKEELSYIWTALMVLGQNNPHLKFGADAILVHSSSFKPENEKTFLGGFSKNSLYETKFKDNAQVSKKIVAHKDLTDVKFGHEKEISQAGKDMVEIKTNLDAVKKSASKNDSDEQEGPLRDIRLNPGP